MHLHFFQNQTCRTSCRVRICRTSVKIILMLTLTYATSLFVQVTIQSAKESAVRACDISRTQFRIKHADMLVLGVTISKADVLVLVVTNSKESVYILCFFTRDKYRVLQPQTPSNGSRVTNLNLTHVQTCHSFC